MSSETELLECLYGRFNRRETDAALAMLHRDVIWANGMAGGHVEGLAGVRDYWTRQWAMIDPHVEPVGFSTGPNGEIVARVHQTVRDLKGEVLSDRMVEHIFRIDEGLVRRFDIG